MAVSPRRCAIRRLRKSHAEIDGGPLAFSGRRGLPRRQVAEAAAEIDVVPELGRDDAGQAHVEDEPPGRDPRDAGLRGRAARATASGSK